MCVLLWVLCYVNAFAVFWFLTWFLQCFSLVVVVVDDVSVVFWLISSSLFLCFNLYLCLCGLKSKVKTGK